MRTLVVAIALAGAVWGCDAKAASPVATSPDLSSLASAQGEPAAQEKAAGAAYTATVKVDDV